MIKPRNECMTANFENAGQEPGSGTGYSPDFLFVHSMIIRGYASTQWAFFCPVFTISLYVFFALSPPRFVSSLSHAYHGGFLIFDIAMFLL